jgi:hypothetical protein
MQRENALEDQYSRAPDQDKASIKENLNSARDTVISTVARKFQDIGLTLFFIILVLIYLGYLVVASRMEQLNADRNRGSTSETTQKKE